MSVICQKTWKLTSCNKYSLSKCSIPEVQITQTLLLKLISIGHENVHVHRDLAWDFQIWTRPLFHRFSIYHQGKAREEMSSPAGALMCTLFHWTVLLNVSKSWSVAFLCIVKCINDLPRITVRGHFQARLIVKSALRLKFSLLCAIDLIQHYTEWSSCHMSLLGYSWKSSTFKVAEKANMYVCISDFLYV